MKMKTTRAFTLIELLVVVAIIGILAAVGTPIFQGFMLDAKINASIAKHQNIKDFISANLMRCSAGAQSIKLQEYYGQQSVSCSDTPWNLAIAFAKHFKYTGMKNPYDTDGLSIYASTDECLGLGVATIWGSSNANQGKFVRVTTRVSEAPNSCSKDGRRQIYILFE